MLNKKNEYKQVTTFQHLTEVKQFPRLSLSKNYYL